MLFWTVTKAPSTFCGWYLLFHVNGGTKTLASPATPVLPVPEGNKDERPLLFPLRSCAIESSPWSS